jgi:pyruvate/2-oxoglutarate dehydrogenase complex dihydrolipoamide acyltransferase (E2) component
MTDQIPVFAPLAGTIVSVVADGVNVRAGEELVIVESMKMHHAVTAPVGGVMWSAGPMVGDVVAEGDRLAHLDPDPDAAGHEPVDVEDPEGVRADLLETLRRHEIGLDAARPDAVARRRASGQRTARENVADVCDPGTFVEYGALTIAAQRQRRTVEELIARTPADGLVTGVATVNADLFGADASGCVVMAYDYTVLAGTRDGTTTARPTGCSTWPPATGCRSSSSPRAAADGRATPTPPPSPASESPRSTPWVACPAWYRSWASPPGGCSPAMPRCSAAATSSSPPPAPASAWAGRR